MIFLNCSQNHIKFPTFWRVICSMQVIRTSIQKQGYCKPPSLKNNYKSNAEYGGTYLSDKDGSIVI